MSDIENLGIDGPIDIDLGKKQLKDMSPTELADWFFNGNVDLPTTKLYIEPSDWMLEDDIDYGK